MVFDQFLDGMTTKLPYFIGTMERININQLIGGCSFHVHIRIFKNFYKTNRRLIFKEEICHNNSSNWTFRQYRFNCQHQQCKQGSTKSKELMIAEPTSSKRPLLRMMCKLPLRINYGSYNLIFRILVVK